VGTFALGTNFESDGTLVMSEENFVSLFPDRRIGAHGPDVGVLRVRQGADLERLRAALQAELPPDVRVLTKPGLVAREQAFWDSVAPLGTVFNIGVVMGFIVGMAICYQVLYSDIGDRLGEFATLKAMGYSDTWLLLRVVEQAVYLALLGYAAGVVVSLRSLLIISGQAQQRHEANELRSSGVLGEGAAETFRQELAPPHAGRARNRSGDIFKLAHVSQPRTKVINQVWRLFDRAKRGTRSRPARLFSGTRTNKTALRIRMRRDQGRGRSLVALA
jgi:hypothetical protein